MLSAPDYVRFLVTLTAIIDPFLAVPLFLTVTAGRPAAHCRRLINAVCVTVFAVLAGAALTGEQLLLFMGASLAAFRVGGGLVLLLMALAMLNAQPGAVRVSDDEVREAERGEVEGVVPLAVPVLAGPGAISSVIIVAQSGGGVLHLGTVIFCIGAVCVLAWVILRMAAGIGEKLGTTGLNIATRLLGLLLAALAIQIMAGGLRELFPGLT